MFSRSRPTIDFDTVVALLDGVYVGRYVTVNVFERGHGGATATFGGWLVRLQRADAVATAVIRDEPVDAGPYGNERVNLVIIRRETFTLAGEWLRDHDGFGDLAIETGHLWVVISGLDVAPDWNAVLC
jgi:hypothetical protein